MQMSLPADRYRRIAGLVLGGGLGLVFGLIPYIIERIDLPSIPLYRPPFGPLGNVAGWAVGVALLGLLISWPRSGIAGIFLAALVSVIVLLVYNAFAGGTSTMPTFRIFITSLFLVLPLWALAVAIVAVVRWGAAHLEEAHRDRAPLMVRAWRPALLVVLVAALGFFQSYSTRAQAVLTHTHALLQAGQQAPGALPPALTTAEVGDFAALGQGSYLLSWEGTNIERYRIPRPGRNFDLHSVVVARFANGWNLVCLFIETDEDPLCKGLPTLPR